MTDVYQKYMHRIAIAITTRLQDQGKGLIMLPMNPLPILFPSKPVFFFPQKMAVSPGTASYFPEEVGITRQTGHLFHPQPGSVEYFYHQTRIKYPQLRKDHRYQYLQPED